MVAWTVLAHTLVGFCERAEEGRYIAGERKSVGIMVRSVVIGRIDLLEIAEEGGEIGPAWSFGGGGGVGRGDIVFDWMEI